ncbi:MAG TPA: hypothetical protein VEX86_05350 [Longimicrobium sp.]|nr:hypothetical protein [Longimicrobium sp.]
MMQTALHPPPHLRDALLEQVRVVGLGLRRPAQAAAVLAGLATLLVAIIDLGQGDVIDFHPEDWMLPGMVGLLLPIAVWTGEDRFGPGFLWTLPVDRRRHALARVVAGWAWLMGTVALFVLWLLVVSLVSGERILAEEALRVVPNWPFPGALDPATLRVVRRAPEPLFWLVPFTAATGTYLLASAVAVGVRHPLRWIVGTALVVGFLAAVVDIADASRLIRPLLDAVDSFLVGPYGLDTLLTARTETLKVDATLTTGETVIVWRGLPSVGQWAAATLLWTCAGLALVWAAASRHRERRRA